MSIADGITKQAEVSKPFKRKRVFKVILCYFAGEIRMVQKIFWRRPGWSPIYLQCLQKYGHPFRVIKV